MQRSEQIADLTAAQAAGDRFAEAAAICAIVNAVGHPPRNNGSNGKTAAARFYEKIVWGAGDCWYWRGAKHKLGYGLINFSGESKAHRASWRLHRGDIPLGQMVLHKCDVRSCVNPDHLFLGTQADNMRDAAAKGRIKTRPAFGSANPGAKLTENSVREIRAASGKTQCEMAAEYGVSQMTISRIINRQLWRHV